MKTALIILCSCLAADAFAADPAGFAKIEPATTTQGYLARLLINETSFPGEAHYVSEDDTRAAMLSILWVLHSRIHYIPPGYTQQQVAAIRSDNIVDIITGNGEKRICESFFRDAQGRPKTAQRVEDRINYLLKIANSGGKPGRFASLLTYAQGLAAAYLKDGIHGADQFAGITRIDPFDVTGRAYSWMTDQDCYHPGGWFVRIPNNMNGSLGGNRFFSLRKDPGS